MLKPSSQEVLIKSSSSQVLISSFSSPSRFSSLHAQILVFGERTRKGLSGVFLNSRNFISLTVLSGFYHILDEDEKTPAKDDIMIDDKLGDGLQQQS
ncbi:hypothetical protein MSAN_02034400 [Mycena sanguinolenta]|uniref:Uncharacterized protein n=1 Tax=Mycena sanguinolenta TaxID=230812 RepID=A0A8H6XK44_9AGAR|nr:hypothetical protein MSAN_02034400 [Mycena sanguinolenta]